MDLFFHERFRLFQLFKMPCALILMFASGFLTVAVTAKSPTAKNEQNRKSANSVATSRNNSSGIVVAQKETLESSGLQSVFALVKTIHPVIIAIGQVLLVIGICLLLTDNRELELYLKIDFKPPQTDILK